MINVNKITSVLARMPDQQLQQYAEMHKNDPYIVTLALSESNRRKEMRSAGQGTQGEQPKVVDQLLAAMPPRPPQPMPEDVGIGALPVANMNFAEGGIIAFGDGGDVERYQVGGDTMGGFTPDLAETEMRNTASAMRTQEMQRARTLQELEQKVTFLTNAQAFPQAETARKQLEAFKASGQLPTATSTAALTPAASFSPADIGGMDRRMMTGTVGTAPAPKPKPDSLAAPAARPAFAPAAPSGLTSIDALQKKYFGSLDADMADLKTGRAGLVSGIKELAAENLKATEADIAKRGDVFKSREERLSAQEKRIGGMDTQNTGLALLQAGAAMMSTPGGLGVALGKGVAIGSERYAAGIDKINAAKDKFADARDRLDDLRINRDDMNDKDIRAAKKEARESELKGKELLYNGLVSDLGIKQKNVSSIFSAATQALNTQIEQGGANARSAAQIAATLNTPDRLVFNQLLIDNKNNPVAAAEALQKMKAEKFNAYDAYSKYLQAFAGKDTLKGPDDFDVFAKRFIPTVTPNKNTTVRTQPGG